MSLTSEIKQAIVEHYGTYSAEKKSLIACLLRFSGGIHLVSRHIVIESEVDDYNVMIMLTRDLERYYHVKYDVIRVGAGGIRKGDRYVIRVVEGAKELAQQCGLLDRRGHPTRGIHPGIVTGNDKDAIASWAGAFLARGSLSQPGRSGSLEITCPGPEAALALVGTARRLKLVAKSREVRGSQRVVIRDGEQIATLLNLMGAKEIATQWLEQKNTREIRSSVNRLANFDDANLRRSVKAAVTASARVKRAFEILGEDIPEHLEIAGRLRLEYAQASLEELGRKAEPPLTKDAIAGRIRRLLALADKVAEEKQIPDTNAGIDKNSAD